VFQPAWKVILVTPTFRIRPERSGEFARSGEFSLSEALRDIIVEEQDHEIDLKDDNNKPVRGSNCLIDRKS